MTGKIFDIKRFAVHDGDGIRTTVFFKGCPLRCKWCHNPEGLDAKAQLAFFGNLCTNCGSCAEVCSCHKTENGKHIFFRENCENCGNCVSTCFKGALKLYGKNVTVDELMPLLLADRDFYENSGGGVTLSGGECLLQADFCSELLKALKAENISTAVDTCGFVPRKNFEAVLPYTDIFLYDIKAIDEDIHIKATGQSNRIILDNLKYLDSMDKKIEIRIPYVPDYNASQLDKIRDFLSDFKNITKVRVLPYHNLAGNKYESLGMKNTLPLTLPEKPNAVILKI